VSQVIFHHHIIIIAIPTVKVARIPACFVIIHGVKPIKLEHTHEIYQVNTPVYEGPLDLLLDLIERAELDITRLALAQVTDQYLSYIQTASFLDPYQVSDFLIIAARLLQIKSAVLLPQQSTDEETEEEDLGEALVRQLIEYRKFKKVALFLEERQNVGLRTYLRLAPPPIQVEAKLDLSGIGLDELVQAAREILLKKSDDLLLDEVVNIPRVTIREKINTILDTLRIDQKTSFNALLTSKSRIDIVITFLAILELIKRNIIEAQQSSLFEDIQMQTRSEVLEPGDFDLEFDN
jgi:segregation and condensation protein A